MRTRTALLAALAAFGCAPAGNPAAPPPPAATPPAKPAAFSVVPLFHAPELVTAADDVALQKGPNGEIEWFPVKNPRDKRGDVSGFVVADRMSPASRELAKGLPRYRGRYDFDRAKDYVDDKPWRAKGFDIRDPKDALRFALFMQKFVYEGNLEGATNEDRFDVGKNTKRYWCSTPWMTAGKKGREPIHGLTKEFPLSPSPVYPREGMKIAGLGDPSKHQEEIMPVSWGTAFFNASACTTYLDVFGTPENPKPDPDWSKATPYDDGFVSFKLLFTPASEAEIPALKNAFTWKAHAGYFKKVLDRSIRDMKHVQMDISFKDSAIKGMTGATTHWGMLTYYHDPDYSGPAEYKELLGDAPFESILDLPGVPPELMHMRPAGISFGFEAGESIIFPGSDNNHQIAVDAKAGTYRDLEYAATRLNGPVDNPHSTCLGCHALSWNGPDDAKPVDPGVLTNAEFAEVLAADKDAKRLFDFNMQVGLARKYRDWTKDIEMTRKGVEKRSEHLASAPKRGLSLESNGLVNETFRISVDFDAKTIRRVTRHAADGREDSAARPLTDEELGSLLADRDRVWREWTAPPRSPAAEYQEYLYLLEGDSATQIRADGGFHETAAVAADLARRMQSLAPKK